MDYFDWPELDGRRHEWVFEWFDVRTGKNRTNTFYGGNVFIRILITLIFSNLPVMRVERKR